MADRVHPHESPARPPSPSYDSDPESPTKVRHPSDDRPVPPPSGTYVIQIPKDQIYRVPPSENASRVRQFHARQKPRRGCRCCCRRLCCCLLFLLVAAALAVGIAAALVYFVVKPEAPDYSVTSLAISGLNLTSASAAVSPAVDVAVRAANGNGKIGIYYGRSSSVELLYSDVKLCDGSLPAFYQPANNVTVFTAALKGNGIVLTSQARTALVTAQNQGKVPLRLNIRAPVKFKVGAVKTWEITVKVDCDITVDKLTSTAKIESKVCSYGVDIFS